MVVATDFGREAYENYITEDGEFPSAAKRLGDGYQLPEAHMGWQFWKAAIAHVRGLPKPSLVPEGEEVRRSQIENLWE